MKVESYFEGKRIGDLEVEELTSLTFDYEKHKCCCPRCGGVGWCWGGSFTCDGEAGCNVIADIASGRVFREAPPTDIAER